MEKGLNFQKRKERKT